ncbi:MAG: hypothetical protein A3J24_12870 [Deltaproteobacteria bacterium RIFCSPLOWO2_02_FULL_53_8]|nr:MAG: hypothetical protein A3J24_12870 [Deltaproteobacteria bacterium RIFCSPLOWO2_02_FULL_53_8]
MSPVEEGMVRRKLAVIVEALNALAPIKGMTAEQYQDDLYKRKAAERLMQELIEAAIDINTHIIVHTGNTSPDDYYESFIRLGELKVISMTLAEKLAPSAGLRNRLVHEYDTLKDSIVLKAIDTAEGLYPQYIKEIDGYITKKAR